MSYRAAISPADGRSLASFREGETVFYDWDEGQFIVAGPCVEFWGPAQEIRIFRWRGKLYEGIATAGRAFLRVGGERHPCWSCPVVRDAKTGEEVRGVLWYDARNCALCRTTRTADGKAQYDPITDTVAKVYETRELVIEPATFMRGEGGGLE